MDVSVIIVNYNTCNLVKKCVASIFEKTKNVSFEVIVVDNNSKDGSVEAIIDEFPRVRVFPLKENIGFGKANNIGVKHAKGRFVFFLNSGLSRKNIKRRCHSHSHVCAKRFKLFFQVHIHTNIDICVSHSNNSFPVLLYSL